jgi:hypothetical protein
MTRTPLPIAFASLALLAGCTSWKLAEPSTPPLTLAAPPAGRAQICVLRTSLLAAAVTFPVRDNGALVGATRGRGSFCYTAAPGRHAIDVEADDTEHAELVAEAGGRYYLAQEVDNVLGWVRCRAVWLAEPVAREKLASLPYRVLVGVPGQERLPGEAPFAAAR